MEYNFKEYKNGAVAVAGKKNPLAIAPFTYLKGIISTFSIKIKFYIKIGAL